MAPQIDPKRLQNPFGNELEILVKLNVDFEPNLAQLRSQLGLNLGLRRRPNRAKRVPKRRPKRAKREA